jgi:hypothetical protein
MRQTVPHVKFELFFGCFGTFSQDDKAWGDSPHFSCGIPTTAISWTAGWRRRQPSTSIEEMFSPPLIITQYETDQIFDECQY